MIMDPEKEAKKTIQSIQIEEDDPFNAIEGEYLASLASIKEAPDNRAYHQTQAKIYRQWLENDALESLEKLQHLTTLVKQEWILK